GGVRGGFMVPLPAQKRKEALHASITGRFRPAAPGIGMQSEEPRYVSLAAETRPQERGAPAPREVNRTPSAQSWSSALRAPQNRRRMRRFFTDFVGLKACVRGCRLPLNEEVA